MPGKPFDASLKHLLETYAHDLVAYFQAMIGLPELGTVEVIDADVSTVSAAADKVYRIGGNQPWLFHLELQASHHHRLAEKLLLYNVLLRERHRVPVRSTVLLLRPEADRSSLTGVLRESWPADYCYHEFRYDVIRLWRLPVESLFQAGPGLLPLVPLANVAAGELESVIGRMKEQVSTLVPTEKAKDLWVATYVLLGLQYPREFTAQLLQGVRAMEESVTYQAIVEEGLAKGLAQGLAQGKIQGFREAVLEQAQDKFGAPDAAARAALERIDDLQRLRELIHQLTHVSSWAELLGKNAP
jgi:predicted transposase YdaD